MRYHLLKKPQVGGSPIMESAASATVMELIAIFLLRPPKRYRFTSPKRYWIPPMTRKSELFMKAWLMMCITAPMKPYILPIARPMAM